MTARWVVDEVQPNRDLNVVWQPISLLVKNKPAEDSDYYGPVAFTHKLLRVMEAIRAAEGDAAVERWYWHTATLIHHDKNRDFDVADALADQPSNQAQWVRRHQDSRPIDAANRLMRARTPRAYVSAMAVSRCSACACIRSGSRATAMKASRLGKVLKRT